MKITDCFTGKFDAIAAVYRFFRDRAFSHFALGAVSDLHAVGREASMAVDCLWGKGEIIGFGPFGGGLFS